MISEKDFHLHAVPIQQSCINRSLFHSPIQINLTGWPALMRLISPFLLSNKTNPLSQCAETWLHRFGYVVLLVVFITGLPGCSDQKSSEINKDLTSTPAISVGEIGEIGDTLGVAAPKPVATPEGGLGFRVDAGATQYADANVLIQLSGSVDLITSTGIAKQLWRQITGPEAFILNPEQTTAQVIAPLVTTPTLLEFALLAADTDGRVAEGRTRVQVLPLASSPPANAAVSIGEAGRITVILSLPEPADEPVTLEYNTQDGTALAGRDYHATQGQVTLDTSNPQAVITITALNPDVISGDLYFRVHYAPTANRNNGHSLYVVLPRDRTGAPSQPVEPGPVEPGPIPTTPVEPTEPGPTPTTYNITYNASEGGSIQGNAAQTLSAGQSGTSVTAIAEPGYRFIQWSDGLTTVTRAALDVQTNLQVTAEFRRNQLWLATGHHGNLSVNTGPTTATIDWPTEPGKTYNLYVTEDPETEIQNYGAYGARMFADVTPPWNIGELNTDQPVYVALEEDGELRAWSSFVPRVLGTNGPVNAIALDENGIRYIGGEFTRVSPYTGGGVALTIDAQGSSHTLAGATVDGTIGTVVADGLGGWYIGGSFTSIDSQQRRNLAHLNAAGQLTAWNPGTNGFVHALAINEGVIYVGGAFTEMGGENRSNLAAFDTRGQLLSWNPGVNGSVRALAIDQGFIYVGGSFNQAGEESRKNLAAFDTLGKLMPWRAEVSDGFLTAVAALAVNQGTIYVGGQFSSAATENRKFLAAFDTQGQLLPWSPRIRGTSVYSIVYALSVNNEAIYVGGEFVVEGSENRQALAAFNTLGELLPWNPEVRSGSIYALAVAQDSVYVGGNFWQADDNNSSRLATFDLQGQRLPWSTGANNRVGALAISHGVIYAGGDFTQAGGERRDHLAALDAQGQLLNWNPGVNYWVNTLAVDQSVIYAGGRFTQAGGMDRKYLAAFDAQGQILPWNPEANNSVKALAIDQSVIYSGSEFGDLSAFDVQGGMLPWNPRVSGGARVTVSTLAIDQGSIYVGGWFPLAGDQSRNNFAAFDSHGQLLPWNPEPSDHAYTLAIDQGIIYAGGGFTRAGSQSLNYLMAFDTQGQIAPWNPDANDYALTLALDQGAIYAGGRFTEAGGQSRNHLAAFDASGQLLSWNPGANGEVKILTIDQGVIYAGGSFKLASGKSRSNLATFDPQGNLLNK
jgi:hypothetical protein